MSFQPFHLFRDLTALLIGGVKAKRTSAAVVFQRLVAMSVWQTPSSRAGYSWACVTFPKETILTVLAHQNTNVEKRNTLDYAPMLRAISSQEWQDDIGLERTHLMDGIKPGRGATSDAFHAPVLAGTRIFGVNPPR